VSYGAVWLFAAWVALVFYYRVPTDPLHRDIAGGFCLWSMLMASSELLRGLDPWMNFGRFAIESLAYPTLLAAWCWAAWRRDPGTALSPDALAVLQPWRRVA
jgi:hypothetical protein